jgi:DNA (cytosine-5)-methyltransferase 1
MRFGSLCSGVEAVSLGWEGLGHVPAFFAEIDPFCSAVLKHHWPAVPNLGNIASPDFGDRARQCGPIDVLVAGTPCQAFSVAGHQKGFEDERGNLTIHFLRIVGQLRPQWLLWENVPGVLTNDRGRTFGAILGQVAQLGYRWAYRVLDAQYFGVPQKRRRLFLVGHLGGRPLPDQVLFEPEGQGRRIETYDRSRKDAVAVPPGGPGGVRPFRAPGAAPLVVAFYHHSGLDQVPQEDICPPLTIGSGTGANAPAIAHRHSDGHCVVRRLTPLECERLQGMPDHHTLVPYRSRWKKEHLDEVTAHLASLLGRPVSIEEARSYAVDSLRYRAIGNSMAVPVLRWIGQGLASVCED